MNRKINHIEVQNDLDKEIQIYKSSFSNVMQRIKFLIDIFEEMKKIRENEGDMMTTLNEFHSNILNSITGFIFIPPNFLNLFHLKENYILV